MSIKRSTLEQKWYYRIGKVIFWLPPLLTIATALIVDWKNFYEVLQTGGNIFDVSSTYLLIVAILYILILGIVWRVFLYIVFGGFENDAVKKTGSVVSSVNQLATPTSGQDGAAVVNYLKEAERKKSDAVTWIILIIIFIWALYYNTSSTPSSSTTRSTSGGGSRSSSCVSTGCGSNWRCSGTYYSSSGAQKSISGCYANKTSVTSLNSWSGICQLCP